MVVKVAGSPLLAPSYRRLLVVSMLVICTFNFADRAVFSVLVQPIKADLKLTDFQIGILQGLSFAILYALLGLPIGRLAEYYNRVRIVAIATAIWSVMTVATGISQNFIQLMFSRVGVGMGEAGFVAPTSSLVADHFPANRRASIMALVMLGTPVGIFMGSLVAGWVADQWHWRVAFWALGIPGVVSAFLLTVVLREPPRGLADGIPPTQDPPPDFMTFLRVVISKRSMLCMILAGGTAGFGMNAIGQFLAVYLARVLEMSIREAGAFYGTISGLSLGLGLLVGSFGTDWLAKYDRRWPAWGSAIGLVLAPLIYYLAFGTRDRLLASILLTTAGSLLLFYYAPTIAMIQNMLEPRMRASGVALFTMLFTIFGAGMGPTFVGFMSDHFAKTAFTGGVFFELCPGGLAPDGALPALASACDAASAQGLQQALYLAVSVLFVSALIYYLGSRSMLRDLYVPVHNLYTGRTS